MLLKETRLLKATRAFGSKLTTLFSLEVTYRREARSGGMVYSCAICAASTAKPSSLLRMWSPISCPVCLAIFSAAAIETHLAVSVPDKSHPPCMTAKNFNSVRERSQHLSVVER